MLVLMLSYIAQPSSEPRSSSHDSPYAEPVPLPCRRCHRRWSDLCGYARARGAGAAATARDQRHDPAGSLQQAALADGPRHAEQGGRIGGQADRAVPRHAGSRARRPPQHAPGLPVRSRRLFRLCRVDGKQHRDRLERRYPRLSRDARAARIAAGVSGAQAVRGAPALPLSVRRAVPIRRPGRNPGGTQARALAAENAIDRRDRSPDRRRTDACRHCGTFRRRTAPRRPPALPAGIAVRDGTAGVRTGRPARLRGTPGSAHADGPRQGRQGAHGSAE